MEEELLFENPEATQEFDAIPKEKYDEEQAIKKGQIGIVTFQLIICLVLIIIFLGIRLYNQVKADELLSEFKNEIQTKSQFVDKIYDVIGDFITKVNQNGQSNGAGGGINLDVNEKNVMPKNVTMQNVIYTGASVFPLENYNKTSDFGFRESPFDKNKKQFHNALDLGAVTGEKIHASISGKVIESGEDKSLGLHIIIDAGNGFHLTYAHCSRLIAKVGMNIRANEVIALVGSTGDSTGSHLHFATDIDGVYFNPENIFDATFALQN